MLKPTLDTLFKQSWQYKTETLLLVCLFFTCHSKSTHKQPDVSASHHDGLAAVGAFRLPAVLVLHRRPDAHHEDEQIEDRDSHKPLDMDGHGRVGPR